MRGHAQPMPFSRGFRGRRVDVDPARVPPGQYVTRDFPVLSAGPTPRTPLDEWSLTINGAVEEPVSWPWEEFVALPRETVTVDIHFWETYGYHNYGDPWKEQRYWGD
jgi:DMSO/TMAO reductase YedYZ molybdopterin-dependent catalytic subunit